MTTTARYAAPGIAILGLLASLGGQAPPPARPDQPAGSNWPTYLGDRARTHYSTLSQINKANVSRLQPVWTYLTGSTGVYQTNPLIVDGVLYTRTTGGLTVALDAGTGTEIWKVNPAAEAGGAPGGGGGGVVRGLVYWDGGGGDRRLLVSSGPHLYALNAANGQSIPTFGENGRVHLGQDLDVDGQPNMTLATPGVVFKDLLIIGSNPGEGATAPPGHIRAYDLRTGARRWIFHTIPHPGEFGHETWPADYWKSGAAANNWAGMALDEPRGIVYVPTGSPGGDFWGAERWGQGLFANSLIALDASTGRRLWHFQVVHHDLLDKDLPTPPVLLTVNQNGRRIDAVAQGTKHGLIFVFDRVTGQPLWPIEERPVPQSEIAGVRTWPTQPFPTKPAPLMRQTLTPDDASTISVTAQAASRLRLQQSPNRGPFPAPSLREGVMFPGFDGGMEWGGAATDPDGIYYVNVNEIPWFYQMIANQRPDGSPVSMGERTYQLQCANCHGLTRVGDPAGGFPSLANLQGQRTPEQVHEVLDRAGARMPSFADLQQGQRMALVDYLFGVEKPASEYPQPAARGRGGAAGVGPAPAGAPAAAPQPGRGVVAPPAAGAGGGRGAATPYSFRGFQRWNVEGYPGIKPPWGTLNAVDMNTGEIKWKVPLGEYAELTARGIPQTGTENYGGPVVTAGGLVFIAATADEKIRAFDKDTGRVLWEGRLPFSGTATPSVYAVNGKQYIVISAGGGRSGRPTGGSIVAFALPD